MNTTSNKSQVAKDFEVMSVKAPKGSSEHRLYSGLGKTPTLQGIEHRIDYLKHRAPHLSRDYRMAAIAYLEEELGKRRKENQPDD